MEISSIVTISISILSILSYFITFFNFFKANQKARQDEENKRFEERQKEIQRSLKLENAVNTIQNEIIDIKKILNKTTDDTTALENRIITCENKIANLEREIFGK